MKARDTVITASKMISIAQGSNRGYKKHLKDKGVSDEFLQKSTRRLLQLHFVANAQAEITGKIMLEQGRKEVVERVEDIISNPKKDNYRLKEIHEYFDSLKNEG